MEPELELELPSLSPFFEMEEVEALDELDSFLELLVEDLLSKLVSSFGLLASEGLDWLDDFSSLDSSLMPQPDSEDCLMGEVLVKAEVWVWDFG